MSLNHAFRLNARQSLREQAQEVISIKLTSFPSRRTAVDNVQSPSSATCLNKVRNKSYQLVVTAFDSAGTEYDPILTTRRRATFVGNIHRAYQSCRTFGKRSEQILPYHQKATCANVQMSLSLRMERLCIIGSRKLYIPHKI